MNKYLSCCIEESKDEANLTMIQPHVLTQLIKNFGEEIEGKRKFLTPGVPRFKIGTWIHVFTLSENSSKMTLLKSSLSVQLKMTLISLRRTLIRSCLRTR
jgi:hypothetical protein